MKRANLSEFLAYIPHPECEVPGDDTALWHYMDFTKFVDLVATAELYLRRVDKLDDQREGRFTEREFTRLKQRRDDLATSTESGRSLFFVNCWCGSERESMAMWDLYGGKNHGVAVKTTMESLKAAISGAELPIYIGRVQYRDWKRHDVNDKGNMVAMCLRKADGYSCEKEVRLVFWAAQLEPVREPAAERDTGTPINVERVAEGVMAELAHLFPSADFTGVNGRLLVAEAWLKYKERQRLEHAGPGTRVPVDVAILMHEVVIGPRAPDWLLGLTRNLLRRYNLSSLSAKVRLSELCARQAVGPS
jgi:hypothetical protein